MSSNEETNLNQLKVTQQSLSEAQTTNCSLKLEISELRTQLRERDQKLRDLQTMIDLHQIKKQPKLDYVLKEAEIKLSKIAKNILDDKRIKAMDSDKLKLKYDHDFHKNYNELQNEVIQIQLKLESFKIENQDTLTDTERRRIEHYLDLCQDRILHLQFTTDRIENEIIDRNIAGERHKPVDTSGIKWRFNGDFTQLHFYSYLELIDNFFKEYRISPEWKGKYLLEFSEGNASKLIQDNFPFNSNPPFNETKMLLKTHFGNKEKIMSRILKRHKEIGGIPEHSKALDLKSRMYTVLQKHCELIDQAQLVRTPLSHNSQEEICPHTEVLLENLNNLQRLLIDSKIKDMPAEEKYQALIKLYKSDKESAFPSLSFDSNKKRKIEDDNESNNPTNNLSTEPITKVRRETEGFQPSSVAANMDFKNQKAHTVTHVRDDSCALCRFMLSEEHHKPDCIRHVTPLQNTSVVFVESCFFIRDLPISERFDYLGFLEYCHICLQHPKKVCWKNGSCMYASRQPPSLICGKCPNRMVTCKEHYFDNQARLHTFKQRYAQLGMDINVKLSD